MSTKKVVDLKKAFVRANGGTKVDREAVKAYLTKVVENGGTFSISTVRDYLLETYDYSNAQHPKVAAWSAARATLKSLGIIE